MGPNTPGGMPDPTINMPQIPGMQNPMQGATAGIVDKMSGKAKPGKAPHIQGVDLLTTAIKSLNQYADLMGQTDEANSRAARMIISVLGEMLKTAQQDQTAQQPPPIM